MRSLVGLLAIATSASAAPRRLTFRYLHVGRALGEYDVTTYTLELDGATAGLGVAGAVTDPKARPDQTGPYLPVAPALYKGTATATGRGVDLVFELAADKPFGRLSCRWKTRDIAAPRALRIETPGVHGECGDRGVFLPANTTRVRVLACGPDDQFVFGAGAGIERAALSEDCYIQGTGLRAIGADREIRRVSPEPAAITAARAHIRRCVRSRAPRRLEQRPDSWSTRRFMSSRCSNRSRTRRRPARRSAGDRHRESGTRVID